MKHSNKSKTKMQRRPVDGDGPMKSIGPYNCQGKAAASSGFARHGRQAGVREADRRTPKRQQQVPHRHPQKARLGSG